MKLPLGIAACLLAASGSYASAQTMKPGLWEIATKMMGGSGEMADAMAQAQKQMDSMPPEQRKMMQDMMAKRGMQMGSGSGGGMRIKICQNLNKVLWPLRDSSTFDNLPIRFRLFHLHK